jgi:hypothetical protein|tara:strand:+ start:860 stop:1213 length:354 start_codon:yes stop_codon:yes gene_type:complete
MLGLLLLYFISKKYNELYHTYNSDKSWPYILLGIASYYGGSFVAGALGAIVSLTVFDYDIENLNDFYVGLLALPFGILTTYLIYKYLEIKWKKDFVDPDLAIEGIGEDSEDEQPLIG